MAKRTKLTLIILAAVMISLTVWIIWGNTALELTEYTISSEDLPAAFSGFRIVQVSDLHNTQIGRDNEKLLSMIRDAEPDIIVITGDLIDSWRTDIDVAVEFAEDAVEIAPCYFVTGNHEARVLEYSMLKEKLIKIGVTVLDDTALTYNQQDAYISLIGINDPSFQTDYLLGDEENCIKNTLNSIDLESSVFQLLLSHRPEFFQTYVECGIDLVLSGHAHGGQFRFPIIGGVYAPNQGLFPEYDAGLYTDGDTNMIISRGIGNSIFPFRFNNRPEVIVITLENE